MRKIKANKIKYVLFLIFGIWFWLWLPSKLFTKPYSTVLLDANNELLCAHIADDGQWRFPTSDSVPIKFKLCITHFEDEYFSYHPGVNPVSIVKSMSTNLKSGKIKSGGSTLTMQVARMMRGNKERTYFQKIIEMLLAIRIECSYSKKSILNLYASNAPYGSNVVGLSAASWRYFGRSQFKLSWAESALLAVLPNAPSLIYPGKNQSLLLQKRNRLLQKLLANKIIDKATYQLSIAEALPTKAFAIPQHAPHLIEYCIKKGLKGKIIKSTINLNWQTKTTELLNKHIQALVGNQIFNACALVADVETGEILSYVGNSSNSKNEHQNFVDIIQAPRSTGSILKPFLYAFMLNENKILPRALIDDVPTQIGSYGPKNFNLTYDGLVPANEAIARSLNVPAIKLLQEYGAVKFHHRLKELGFKTFTKPTAHYGLSLILGGGEATLFDIASAYAAIGRSLKTFSNERNKYAENNYRDLTFLKQEFVEPKATKTSDLISAGSTWFTFKAMTELMRPSDYVGWMQFLNKTKIAWKTGTSFGFRDAWAIGLNSKYIVAVWVGNADGEGRPDLTGTACAAPLMFSIFNTLPNKQWYVKPTSSIVQIKVCKQSGYKATEYCSDASLQEVQQGGEQTKLCTYHKLITLDESGMYRVNSNCYEVHKMKQQSWFVVPPLQEYYFKQKSLFYKSLPPYLQGCSPENIINQIGIIYPRQDFKIYVPIDETEKKSKCIFKATHKNSNATLFWHLDGEYIGSTQKFHEMASLPAVGNHTLLVTDEAGESAQVKFTLIEK